jgi:ABC-2 type transport system ATP-binding protein
VRRPQRRARVEDVLGRMGIGERRRQIAGTLSGGWKQRLALACSTIHQPPLLFLDEPTAGVDPVSRRRFWDEIHRLSAAGTTMLVTTHYMDEAERCHRLAFIFRGALLDVGTPAEIVSRRRLSVVEVDLDGDSTAAAAALRDEPGVEEVAHFGGTLRVTLRGVDDPVRLAADALSRRGLGPRGIRLGRCGVEDAFVSIVRTEDQP